MFPGNAQTLPSYAVPKANTGRIPWGFPEIFVISQTALPALLYLPGTQGFRLSLRVSAFAISLAAFAWWLAQPNREPQHRAVPWLMAVMGLLGLMLFHPTTLSLPGGLAHAMVYFAVLSPILWAPAFVKTPEHFARLAALLLICSGVNSLVGVLQVYDPGTYMPTELSRIVTDSALGLGPVSYIGPNGQVIVRPPGLFDTPGAVAGPGMFAALLGAIFGLSAIPIWQRIGAFLLSGAGLAAIYLSQVRISLVICVLMIGLYGLLLLLQRRPAKAMVFGGLAGGVIALSFLVAFTLGGDSISDRVMTLFSEDPLSVYYRARGVQLDYTMSEMLFEYPLGAGLGRWGMAAGYFGTGSVPSIWAEIQITGWMIDGGVPMLVLYGGALVATSYAEFRIARKMHLPRLAACGAVAFAANLGTAVMIISFTPFVTQIGIQYWFFAGALHGVVCAARAQD
ncbi:MAG TPA: hypothetical protein VNJ03_06415 [Vicinamibacterales bacterium]|nr:hypothetical protein [Vicinamibacterales bacterium]